MTRDDKARVVQVFDAFKVAQSRGVFLDQTIVATRKGIEIGLVTDSGWEPLVDPMTTKEALDLIMLACEPARERE